MSENLRVKITGDASGLNTAIKGASAKLSAFGTKMKATGKKMTMSLTLPLVAVGAAATKMAFDFDKSMTSITALVGVAEGEVSKMGETAKKMAVDTGQSANDAAEALFFITSAGLRGSDAMDVLNMSLKAAAIGLGDTKTIADLSTSAMNAYGKENLSASDATDVLTAAVRLGKLEASQLAGAMGGVIPIASSMGVGFDEVGAAMAAMSKTGTGAAEGATQLNAILTSIAKPTEESRKAFLKMGFTTEGLQQKLADDGLIGTLAMLKDGLAQTGQTFTDIAPNVRAWKGVLDLTGSSMQDNISLFDEMTKATGATDKAFEETAKSASFKMTKGLNAMKSSLLGIGQVILVSVAPAIEKIGAFFTRLSDSFNSLSARSKKMILAFVGIVAAIGPVLVVLGTLLTMAPAIGAAITLMMGPVGLIIIGLTAVAAVIITFWKPIKKIIIGIANYFIDLYNNVLPLQFAISNLIFRFKTLFAVAKFVFKSLIAIIKAYGKAALKVLGSVGDILIGIFTLDTKRIKKGFSGIGDALSGGVSDALDGVKSNAKVLANTVVDNFNDSIKKKTIERIKVEAEVVPKAETSDSGGTVVGTGDSSNSNGGPKGSKFKITPVIDPEAAEKLKAISDEINKALITNEKLAHKALKQEKTKYYNDLIKAAKGDAEKQKALLKAKTASLAKIESDEENRLLGIKQRIADSTHSSDAERKKLEIQRIKLHYQDLIRLATENGLSTVALLKAQGEAVALVNDEQRASAMEKAFAFSEGMKEIITGGLNDLAAGIGESLGKALASGGNLAQSLSKVVLGTIGNMASQLGKLAIGIGIGVKGIKKALQSLNPAVAIAGGIALIALGAFASAQAGKIGSGGGGATAFAKGGIVSGPTMGLVGEYPGAKSNPEVIAPLNKLQGMIDKSGGTTNVTVGGQIRLEGQDLLIAIERANDTANRLY